MVRALLALLAFLTCVPPAVAAPRKNIILVVADDLGFELGCYGNQAIRTPHLDQLAKEGTRFSQAYCTTASCSPSRSVILTGLHNHANGQYGLSHNEHHFVGLGKAPTLPGMLQAAGYRTAIAGKLHVLPEEAYKFDTIVKCNPRNAVQMAQASRAFLMEKSDKPFFLYFCPTDPHRGGGTRTIGNEKADAFGNTDAGFPGVDEQKYSPNEVIVPPFLPDTPTVRAELSQYYQSVSRVDQGIGKLREILAKAGLEKDTLIVVTSDNGIAFPGAKTTVYDPGIHLPMIVYDPAASRHGELCEAMVSHVDLTPTLLDFADATPSGTKFHGRSWRKLIDGADAADWNEVYASHTFHEVTMYYPMRAVRDRKYKLIWNLAHPLEYPFASDLWGSSTWQEALGKGEDSSYGRRSVKQFVNRPEFELYDLAADPDETQNLASSKDHAEVMEKMKGKLLKFQKQTGDPWQIKQLHE